MAQPLNQPNNNNKHQKHKPNLNDPNEVDTDNDDPMIGLSNLRKMSHSERLNFIINNPPTTIDQANTMYLQFHSHITDEILFITIKEMRQLYIRQANFNHSHPGHELLTDLSIIGHLCCYSGVTFKS